MIINTNYGIDRRVESTGSLGIGNVKDETKIRFVITNADASNEVEIYGRITEQSTWILLDTLTGSLNIDVDVFTYDQIEVIVTNFDSLTDHFIIVGQSFTQESGGSGGGTWGSITGLLSDQTDLQDALDLKADLSIFDLLNPEEIYVDVQGGSDTTGTGSVVLPLETIEKALTLTTDTSKHYNIFLSPGQYGAGPITIPSNVNVSGRGASIDVTVTIDFIPLSEAFPIYSGLSLTDVTFDMSPASLVVATFSEGTYNITRTDNTFGVYLYRVNDSIVNDFSLTGNASYNNVLFTGTGTVENGGQLLLDGCIQGTNLNVIGTGIIVMSSCIFPGSITGTPDGPNTPTVMSDSSSFKFGGTITGANVVDMDSSLYISFSQGTPSDWTTDPQEVKAALDELAARPVGTAAKYTDDFVIADFTGPTLGIYELSYPAATHLIGLYPLIQVFELSGAVYSPVDVQTVIDGSGNIVISVNEVPDQRFDGRIIIQ